MTTSDGSDDFLDRVGVSDSLRALISRTAQEFETTGDWVTFDTLAYEAADQDVSFGLREVFMLPSVIGGVWSGEKISLTGLGLVLAGTAPRTVAKLVELARICAERKRELKNEATISQKLLVEEYGFHLDDAVRASDLVSLLPGVSSGGQLGEGWSLSIFRTALEYRNVRTVDDLRMVLEALASEWMQMHQQSLAPAPAFAEGSLFDRVGAGPAGPEGSSSVPQPDDSTAVFVVHGRDSEAKDAMFAFLQDLGLHPLDWENDLVALTGQGSPFVGEILNAAFSHAQAVIVLMTPDDLVRLHPELVRPGEQSFEQEAMCQPRPNVLFEAGMAFGYCPTRTILVEIGTLRPVSDLGGRHTVRLGTEETLSALARRLEVAGCSVARSDSAGLGITRFTALAARSRQSPPEPI